MSDRIRLSDDGTLDTVLICRVCGAEARYTYDGCEDHGMPEDLSKPEDACKQYQDFVAWAIDDFDADHDCSESREN